MILCIIWSFLCVRYRVIILSLCDYCFCFLFALCYFHYIVILLPLLYHSKIPCIMLSLFDYLYLFILSIFVSCIILTLFDYLILFITWSLVGHRFVIILSSVDDFKYFVIVCFSISGHYLIVIFTFSLFYYLHYLVNILSL